MPAFSPHARGSKSMLSHCYLPPEPLPQQQRRDLALLTQLHRRDRTFIAHDNQAFQHPLVHGPWIDRIEVNPCPTLKTGDCGDPPLDQNPHAHGDRRTRGPVVPLLVTRHLRARRRVHCVHKVADAS